MGSTEDPFRCPNAASLAYLLQSVLTQDNLTIHFMGGVFEVPAAGIELRKGWKLRGAGIDNTILRMKTNAVSGLDGYVVHHGSIRKDGAELSDLTIDCNAQNQTSPVYVAAAGLMGSNTRISRVKAINWATFTTGKEAFVVLINAFAHETYTNCVIEDCLVTQPAPVTFADGATAITIFTEGDNQQTYQAILRNNVVRDITAGLGTSGSPAYLNAYGDAAGGMVINNYAANLINGSGVYRDTWNARNVLITGNTFDNVSGCVVYNITGGYGVDGLVIQNNVLRPAENGIGISIYTGEHDSTYTNSFVKRLVINNNVIYPATGATNTYALALNSKIDATVLNNVIHGTGTGKDFFVNWPNSPENSPYPHSLQLNTFAGNVNLDGTQLKEGNDAYWQPGESDSIKFTATSPGWYRIMSKQAYMAGSIAVESEFWSNSTTDTEFWYRVNSYTSVSNSIGELAVSRRGSRYYPWAGNVPAARIVSEYSSSLMVHLDIYVPNGASSGTTEIKVTARGPKRSRLLTSPQLISTTPSLYREISLY